MNRMSDDLISRKALMEGRVENDPVRIAAMCADTAFNKERVIDELKRMEEESCKEWNEYGDAASLGKVITFAETIEIVEKGGIE